MLVGVELLFECSLFFLFVAGAEFIVEALGGAGRRGANGLAEAGDIGGHLLEEVGDAARFAPKIVHNGYNSIQITSSE
jgi:hypothetical protein